jgi:hypothetical protein
LRLWAHALSFDGTSVHSHISQVRQQLLRTILGLNELEKLWCVVDKLERSSVASFRFQEAIAYCCPSLPSNKNVVSEKAEQERYVGLRMREQYTEEEEEYAQGTNLDTSDAELHQSSKHLPPGNFICRAADGNLDEKTVIVGLVP